ncbi:uncharacterized protein LY89DRAFT_781275 [Mollisia scopiformis]|uniref:Uncharacterized protein n=1 Tax=Mollisia scopiformis TaxID=149040 RepID=A0A194XDD5_MOLSC|nr:uncharacterized protein LY89DRAFT_781275 [Mollisia scopiformis]KUJ18190.1 hypothetical protein LY89DRAFT_781275 [Mollisia scopiformis]
MIEVVTILKAISASIGVLNFAWHGVKEFRDHGKIMARFILDVQTIHQLLGLWEIEWKIGDSEDEGIKCFGPDGWRLIRQQIASIVDTSLGLVGLLAPPLPSGKNDTSTISEGTSSIPSHRKLLKRSGPPPEILLGREFLNSQSHQTLEALQEYKSYEKFCDKSSSFGQKLWDVLISKNTDVLEKIKSLAEGYRQLETLSDSSFEACYKNENLSATMPIQVRQDAVQRRYDSKYAIGFRKNATSIIYASAFPTQDAESIGLQLEEQVLSASYSVQDTDAINYTLILEPSKREGSFELSVKAVGPRRPEAIEPASTFTDACEQARDSYQQKRQVWLQVNSKQEFLYYSIVASPSQPGGEVSRLAERLRSQYPEQLLPYRESLELLFRLTCSSYLLLNTPWMSAFSSECLIIRKGGEMPPRYSLGFREIDGSRCQVLKALQTSSEPEAYSIGILLIELALRKKVTGFQNQPLKIQLLGEDKLEPLNKIIDRAGQRLTRAFAKILRQCFFQIQVPRDCYDQEQKDDLELYMLEGFYRNVLKPLERMSHKRIAVPSNTRPLRPRNVLQPIATN